MLKRKGIIGIYLAAGKSKRFGANKLFAQVGTNPLGSLALETAIESQLDKIVVVTAELDELNWVSSHLFSAFRKKWFQTVCKEAVNGQSYSLKCGLRFAEKLNAEAVIIMLADQPFISKEMVNKIIVQYKQKEASQDPHSFIAATHSSVSCPPILFRHNMFEDLHHLQGDKGARYLIQNKMTEGSFIEFKNKLLFFDVDTQKDYKTFLVRKGI